MALSPLNQRRWNNFKKTRRAYWSLWIFSVLFGLSLFAEFLAYEDLETQHALHAAGLFYAERYFQKHPDLRPVAP